MNNMFGTLAQHFIKNVMAKKNTCVLELIMFHDTIQTKSNRAFIVLSCVIYTMVDNFVYIDYISCK